MQTTLTGYLVGPNWMPGCECWKPLSVDLTRERQRYTSRAGLRDLLLSATHDGDFQSCSIAQGEITVSFAYRQGHNLVRRSRSLPLDAFEDAKDFVHDDPDWFPPCDEDFE